jgi:integrase
VAGSTARLPITRQVSLTQNNGHYVRHASWHRLRVGSILGSIPDAGRLTRRPPRCPPSCPALPPGLAITPKGGKIVIIPLAPRTARALDLAIGGVVFLAADGRPLDRHGAGRIVRRAARRAGIAKTVTPHTLRHAFITAALDAGVPLRDVQEAASHADPRTTMRHDNSRVLHQPGEKPQVSRSRPGRNSVPRLRTAAV